MPQLPPKIPTNTMTTNAAAANSTPTWVVDEFLNFTSSRRATHRRSISDSIAFLEPSDHNHHHVHAGFDKLDDEQLMSMFSDDFNNNAAAAAGGALGGIPSASSEEDDKDLPVLKSEPDSPPSQFPAPPSDGGADQGAPSDNNYIDPKRVKRILANRQSAQRSRVRKLQYISDLERSVTTLQTEVSTLSPRVAFLDHQRLILNVDNSALKQRIAALAQDKIFKDAHQEALKREIERLRQIYQQQQEEQNLKKMNINNNNSAITEIPPYSSAHTTIDKEQLMT